MGRFLKLSAQAASPNHVAPGKQKTNKQKPIYRQQQ